MNKLNILFVFFLTGCSLFWFRESYTLDTMSSWIHFKTNEEVPNNIYKDCLQRAMDQVMGKKDSKIDGLSLKQLKETDPILGQCLYDREYRFFIKGSGLVYCANRPEECEAFSKYRKYMK